MSWQQTRRESITYLLRLCKEEIMKIYFTGPDGWEFYFESEPRQHMSQARFEAICWLVGVLGGAAMVVYLLTSITH